MTLGLTLAADLTGRVRLGAVELRGVRVQAQDDALQAEIERVSADFRARFGGGPSGDVPGTGDARALYKALGLDPTKTRPSNEALLRRVLKGEALYRVNSLVDALNLCSLIEQLPFGLYDLARVRPPITLRRGAPGESYEGIRKGPVNVEARPVLCDAEGAFGNPTSDSLRTCVSEATRDALVVLYAPAAFTPARVGRVLDATRDTLARFCGGAETTRWVLPAS